MSAQPINTHNLVCDFGRHRGELYTRIPVAYLKWLANTPSHRAHEIAKAELARRGTVTPSLEVSGHAIDRASLRCRAIWHQTANGPEEGIHAWLCRVAAEALEKGADKNGCKEWIGIAFVFETDGVWPVLKTVKRLKELDPHGPGH